MFFTRPIKHYNLGERLKNEREKLGINLEQLSRLTKIPKRHIENLEDNKFLSLPPEVYVQGFLKSCADFFRIDKDEILEQYRREKKVALRKHFSIDQARFFSRYRFIITPAVIQWIVFISAVALIGGYFLYQVGVLLRPPDLTIDFPASDVAVDEPIVTVKGRVSRSHDLYFNGSLLLTDKEGIFEEKVGLQPGLNTLEFRAVNRFGKERVILRQVILKNGDVK